MSTSGQAASPAAPTSIALFTCCRSRSASALLSPRPRCWRGVCEELMCVDGSAGRRRGSNTRRGCMQAERSSCKPLLTPHLDLALHQRGELGQLGARVAQHAPLQGARRGREDEVFFVLVDLSVGRRSGRDVCGAGSGSLRSRDQRCGPQVRDSAHAAPASCPSNPSHPLLALIVQPAACINSSPPGASRTCREKVGFVMRIWRGRGGGHVSARARAARPAGACRGLEAPAPPCLSSRLSELGLLRRAVHVAADAGQVPRRVQYLLQLAVLVVVQLQGVGNSSISSVA